MTKLEEIFDLSKPIYIRQYKDRKKKTKRRKKENMKYLIKRRETYIAVRNEDCGKNWSKYVMVTDKNKATVFDTKEEAQKVVDEINKEHLDNISHLRSKEKIKLMNKVFEETFGIPYIVEAKDND